MFNDISSQLALIGLSLPHLICNLFYFSLSKIALRENLLIEENLQKCQIFEKKLHQKCVLLIE